MLRYFLLYSQGQFLTAFAIGLLIALVAKYVASAAPDRAARWPAATGAAIALVFAIAPTLLALLRDYLQIPPSEASWWWHYDGSLRYALPLIAALIAVLIYFCALPRAAHQSSATLKPRSIRSYTSLGTVTFIVMLSLAAIAIALVAGTASGPDENGLYRYYRLNAGPIQAGTWIYGWYYSIPALISLAALLVLLIITLWRIARPPLDSNTELDSVLRKYRSGVITTSTIAALILHLAATTQFLAGTASLKFSGRGGVHGDMVYSWSTFAALEPALRATGIFLPLAGLALWSYVFWRAILGGRSTKRPLSRNKSNDEVKVS